MRNYIFLGDLPGKNQFLLESLQNLFVDRQLRPDHFQSDQAVELEVPSFVDGAHAAFAKNLHNFVALPQAHALGQAAAANARGTGRRHGLRPALGAGNVVRIVRVRATKESGIFVAAGVAQKRGVG